MIAHTPGAGIPQLAECRRLANLLPPLPAQRSDAMPGALGLFRGDSTDYILAKAQQGPSGAPQLQFVLIPIAPLRLLGGNIRTFEAFGREPIPQFAAPRDDLAPFVLENPEHADAEAQIEDLLSLLGFCKNKSATVGSLLAALVQLMGIGVINAPSSLKDRLTFIQGLLTLLPPSVRPLITFATSVLDPGQTNAQIKFLAADMRPARHLIYDWASGKLLTDPPDDPYSKFIMSQFRLDPSLVIEQTRQMDKIVAWRQFQKDELTTALTWAAKRVSLDLAMINNQPVNLDMLADVLRDDPTLNDDMRKLYSQHLLSVTMALDEPARADTLLAVFARHPNIADLIYGQLAPLSMAEDRALALVHLLARWLTGSIEFDSTRWRNLLGEAIITQTKVVVTKGDPAAIRALFESYLGMPSVLGLETPMKQVIGFGRKPAYSDPALASMVFLLGVTFLPLDGLQRLLAEAALVAALPEPVRAALSNLAPDVPRGSPVRLLTQAADQFGAEYKPVVLARLAEWALMRERIELIDSDVLGGLVEVGSKPLGVRFDVLAGHIVQDMSRLAVLRTLDARSIQYLVAISLVREHYANAVTLLDFYQNVLYKGISAEPLGKMVFQLFRDTPLTITQAADALESLQNGQLRKLIHAQAYLGTLVRHRWSPEVNFAAQRLMPLLSSDASLIPLVGFDPTLRLIKLSAAQHDGINTLRLASALVENALLLGPKGVDLVDQTYATIHWGPDMTASSLEVVKNYVRRAPLEGARRLADVIGRREGEATTHAMRATLCLRLMFGGADWISLVDQFGAVVALLTDMATTYHESQEAPSIVKLKRTIESMPGGMSPTERQRLGNNCYQIAEQLLALAKVRTRNAPKAPDAVNQLIRNVAVPSASVDALRWIGGHYLQNQPVALDLFRAQPPNLMGSRSLNILLREIDILVALLKNLSAAFPDGFPPLDNGAFRVEVDSLWTALPPNFRGQIAPKLGESAQLFAELISVIGDHGNERSLANNGFGRQLLTGRAQPRSVIDVLRWMNGFFLDQHA